MSLNEGDRPAQPALQIENPVRVYKRYSRRVFLSKLAAWGALGLGGATAAVKLVQASGPDFDTAYAYQPIVNKVEGLPLPTTNSPETGPVHIDKTYAKLRANVINSVETGNDQ